MMVERSETAPRKWEGEPGEPLTLERMREGARRMGEHAGVPVARVTHPFWAAISEMPPEEKELAIKQLMQHGMAELDFENAKLRRRCFDFPKR